MCVWNLSKITKVIDATYNQLETTFTIITADSNSSVSIQLQQDRITSGNKKQS